MDPYNPKNPSYVDLYTPSLKLHQIQQTNSSTPDRAVNILYNSSPLTPHSPTRIIVLTTSNTILLSHFTFQVFPLVMLLSSLSPIVFNLLNIKQGDYSQKCSPGNYTYSSPLFTASTPTHPYTPAHGASISPQCSPTT
ncbi:hypothetical protein BDQ17DRAFT_505952 [Cyathus striatus]|nr:hypothetical protein BDQ17DRAFT_505952 [Cyathus striatus]